jgi:hypothetical protein
MEYLELYDRNCQQYLKHPVIDNILAMCVSCAKCRASSAQIRKMLKVFGSNKTKIPKEDIQNQQCRIFHDDIHLARLDNMGGFHWSNLGACLFAVNFNPH